MNVPAATSSPGGAAPPPQAPRLDLLLDLQPRGADVFVGPPHAEGLSRTLGGLLLGQAVMAAGASVDAGLLPDSLHARFLQAGDGAEPVSYRVTRRHDGRSFATRAVEARQDGTVIFSATLSFHRAEPGLEHQQRGPAVPAPEELADLAAQLASAELAAAEWVAELAGRIPFEVRFTAPFRQDAAVRGEADEPRQRFWMRPHVRLADDAVLHAAALAYASDCFLLSSALPPHRLLLSGTQFASLDHVMWFHTRVHFDDWLLYDQDGARTAQARAWCRGAIHDRHGHHVASVAQEGLVRPLRTNHEVAR